MSDSDENWDIEGEAEDYSQAIYAQQKAFNILTVREISNKMQELVDEYSDMFGISSDESLILLTIYQWKSYKLQEEWLENESKVRVESGISKTTGVDYALTRGKKIGSLKLVSGTQDCCQICLENIIERDALMCGHAFCINCWRFYIEDLIKQTSIVQGKCPNFQCPLKISESMILKYCSNLSKEMYFKLKCDNFILVNRIYRWCPAPNCNFAIEVSDTSSSHEISCGCGFIFCFSCGEEAHRPASCSTLKEWKSKNTTESGNINWILANTKQCPSCRKPIEKNQGCNHMTCQRGAGGCGEEFCWLCMGIWSKHGTTTGGAYMCNKYDDPASNEFLKQQDAQRKSSKYELDKFIWYFERYNNHNKAQILATEKQTPYIEYKIEELHNIKNYPIGELEFLKLAVDQVIKCRRVLKWTYVFGFYLNPGAEKNLFEYLQEKLEENTDHLHELIEKPLDEYLDPNITDKSKFYHYKSNLVDYYQVTKNFFENLLDGIDNGLTSS